MSYADLDWPETVISKDGAPPGSSAVEHIDALIAVYLGHPEDSVTTVAQVLRNLVKLRIAVQDEP